MATYLCFRSVARPRRKGGHLSCLALQPKTGTPTHRLKHCSVFIQTQGPQPPISTSLGLRVHPNTRTPASHLYKPGPPCSSKHKDPSLPSLQAWASVFIQTQGPQPPISKAWASVFIQTQGPQPTISTNPVLRVHPNTRTPASHLNRPRPLCSSQYKDPSLPSQQTWASVFIQTQGPQSTISTGLGLCVHPNTRTPASHLNKPGPPCSSKHKDPSPPSQQASASVFIPIQGPQPTISTSLGLRVHPNTRTPASHLNRPRPLCSSQYKDPSLPSQQAWASVFIQTQGPQSTISTPGPPCSSKHKDPSLPSQQASASVFIPIQGPQPPISTSLGLRVHPNTRTPASHLYKPGPPCSSKHKDPSLPSQQAWASVFIQTQGPQPTISTGLGLCVHPNTRTPVHHLNKPGPPCSSKHKDPSLPSQQAWASVFIPTQGPQPTISTGLGLCVHPNTRTPASHLNKPGPPCSSKHKDPSPPSQQTWVSVFIPTQGPQSTISTNLGLCVHPNTRTPVHHLNKPGTVCSSKHKDPSPSSQQTWASVFIQTQGPQSTTQQAQSSVSLLVQLRVPLEGPAWMPLIYIHTTSVLYS